MRAREVAAGPGVLIGRELAENFDRAIEAGEDFAGPGDTVGTMKELPVIHQRGTKAVGPRWIFCRLQRFELHDSFSIGGDGSGKIARIAELLKSMTAVHPRDAAIASLLEIGGNWNGLGQGERGSDG